MYTRRTMAIEIKTWAPEYTEGVIRTIKAVYDEYNFTWEIDGYHADLYDIQAHYADQGDTFYVALVDGQVVGTVAIERFPLTDGPEGTIIQLDGLRRVAGSDCSMERLYVHPDARKAGVGSALIQHVLNVAKKEGKQGMELWSDKRFGDAHRLYGRFGATVVGDRICFDPDESPEWGLYLQLSED